METKPEKLQDLRPFRDVLFMRACFWLPTESHAPQTRWTLVFLRFPDWELYLCFTAPGSPAYYKATKAMGSPMVKASLLNILLDYYRVKKNLPSKWPG